MSLTLEMLSKDQYGFRRKASSRYHGLISAAFLTPQQKKLPEAVAPALCRAYPVDGPNLRYQLLGFLNVDNCSNVRRPNTRYI